MICHVVALGPYGGAFQGSASAPASLQVLATAVEYLGPSAVDCVRPYSHPNKPFASTREVSVIEVLCGIDVSSTSLQARIGADGAEAEFANSPQGVTRLACFCREHGVTLAVIEATGGYQRRPPRHKTQPWWRENGKQSYRFRFFHHQTT